MSGSTAPARTVYSISPVRRRLLAIVFLLLLVAPAGLLVGGIATGDATLAITGLFLGGLIVLIVGTILWLAAWRYPQLVLDDEGISVRQLGMRLDALGRRRVPEHNRWRRHRPQPPHGGPRRGYPGSVLRHVHGWRTAAGRNDSPAHGGAPVPSDRCLRLLDRPWRSGLALESRAPQLGPGLAARAAQSGTPRPFFADAEGKPVPRRNLIVAGVLTVGGIAIGAFMASGAPFTESMARGLEILVALALAVYGAVNLRGAARNLRDGQWLAGLLWAAMAVVQFLLAVLAVSQGVGG